MRFSLLFSFVLAGASSVLADPSISSFPNSLTLSTSFDPIIAAYWTGLPHHRRTPFSVSPDGKSAYLAYLDSTKKNVVVQQVDTTTFTAVGTAVTIPGFEAAGLVAQNDGFALMATIDASGTTDIPTDNMPIVALIRYKDGSEAWRTPMNGPGVHPADGLTATPDANGDLVYSAVAGLYSAYFVVTAYTGWAAGHFGDSVQYINDSGVLQNIPQSSTFGCSHNTGIGIEAADAPPFATICAEDQGAIWLNTDTRTMGGVKIANENTTNGVSGEPMGGMSGSYSNLALFPSSTNYVFAWQSRGAVDLTTNEWLGAPNTQAKPRWLNHNVAVSTMSSKNTLTGAEASSTLGADGDSQVNWITKSETDDHQNVHVAAISSDLALVTWETLTSPECQPVPLSCSGTYAGTSFQVIDKTGAKVGAAVTDTKVFVSGDIANVGTDKVCWPYVEMTWDLSAPKDYGTPVTKMSFACASTGNGSVAAPVASSSSAAPLVSTIKEAVAVPSPAATISIDADVTPFETPNPSLVPIEPSAEPTVSVPAVSDAPVATSSAAGVVNTPAPSVPTTESVVFITATFPSEGVPTEFPTNVFPTGFPTDLFPTGGVSALPSGLPTDIPAGLPTAFPTVFPTGFPTVFPTGRFPAGSWSRYKGKHGHKHTTFSTKVKPPATMAPSAAAEDDSCEA